MHKLVILNEDILGTFKGGFNRFLVRGLTLFECTQVEEGIHYDNKNLEPTHSTRGLHTSSAPLQ